MLFVIFFELSVIKNERSRVGEKIVVNFFGAENRKLIFIVIISGISPIFFESAGAAVVLLCRFGVFFCLLDIGFVESETVFIHKVFFYRNGLCRSYNGIRKSFVYRVPVVDLCGPEIRCVIFCGDIAGIKILVFSVFHKEIEFFFRNGIILPVCGVRCDNVLFPARGK